MKKYLVQFRPNSDVPKSKSTAPQSTAKVYIYIIYIYILRIYPSIHPSILSTVYINMYIYIYICMYVCTCVLFFACVCKFVSNNFICPHLEFLDSPEPGHGQTIKVHDFPIGSSYLIK